MSDTPNTPKPPAKKRAAKKVAPKPAALANDAAPHVTAKAAAFAAPDPAAAKARELNITLALVTGLSLLLLVASAAIFGAPRMRWVVVALAPAVTALYLVSKRYLIRMPDRPPLIQADQPISLILAAGLPMIIVLCACACAAWPGHDYAIPVIAAAVWFGLTLESALKKA